MKKVLRKNWWVILLGLAIFCAPFTLMLQNSVRETETPPPTLTFSASQTEESETVRHMIAALSEESETSAIAQARAALDDLPYQDRYALAAETAKLDALESAQVREESLLIEDDILPPEEEEVSAPSWNPNDTRLEILLALLPLSLDDRMSDLLRIAYEELDTAARTDLPPDVLARYLDSQPETPVTSTMQEEATTIAVQQETAPVAVNTGSYMGSKNSDKYHLPQCSSAQRIKTENIVRFSTIAEAKSRGYSPCTVCNPGS